MPVNDRIQLRRGTEAQWIAAEAADADTEPLADGEPGVVVDADGVPLYLVVGDTGTEFEDLPRFSPDSALSGAFAPLAAGIEGTGMPEGVVAAPAGTVYRDLAATNGAVVWVKTVGSASSTTGWRPVYGDTGNRALAAWEPDGTFTYGSLGSDFKPRLGTATRGAVIIRRIGNVVAISARQISAADSISAGADRILVPDVGDLNGFRPLGGSSPVMGTAQGNFVFSYRIYGGNLYLLPDKAYSEDQVVIASTQVIATFLTVDPWPSTLPGTAA